MGEHVCRSENKLSLLKSHVNLVTLVPLIFFIKRDSLGAKQQVLLHQKKKRMRDQKRGQFLQYTSSTSCQCASNHVRVHLDLFFICFFSGADPPCKPAIMGRGGCRPQLVGEMGEIFHRVTQRFRFCLAHAARWCFV